MTVWQRRDPERDSTSWQDRAACVDRHPEDFYPITYTSAGHLTHHVREVLRFCQTECTAQAECLEDALATGDFWGIRGGRTPDELRAIAAARGRRRTRDPLPPIAHGTVTGWRQHTARREPVCDPCAAAGEADRIARARAGLAGRHGTIGGYQTHRRTLREEACDECKAAQREQSARVRAAREATA